MRPDQLEAEASNATIWSWRECLVHVPEPVDVAGHVPSSNYSMPPDLEEVICEYAVETC